MNSLKVKYSDTLNPTSALKDNSNFNPSRSNHSLLTAHYSLSFPTCKLPSFTLFELMIGLLLSSLVVLIAYSAFQIVNRQLLHYNQNRQIFNENLFFYFTLSNDIDKCTELRQVGSDGLMLTQPSSPPVNWQFVGVYILRSIPESTDTFHIQNQLLEFQKRPNSDLIETISFQITISQSQLPITLSKHYTRDVLVEEDAKKVE